MLPDTLEGYCLTSPYQMVGRNSEVEYLAKANSLLLLFLQQIFHASTTSPWKGDADAAGIFERDASAPVCEREVDAGKVEMCRRCKKRNADAGTYKREADVVIHKCAVIFFFIMVKFSTAQLR
ncbi:unnamed protein product [Rhizophagus irregularis]|nr:unnamed protein product [Rhizophagus irregularis]